MYVKFVEFKNNKPKEVSVLWFYKVSFKKRENNHQTAVGSSKNSAGWMDGCTTDRLSVCQFVSTILQL